MWKHPDSWPYLWFHFLHQCNVLCRLSGQKLLDKHPLCHLQLSLVAEPLGWLHRRHSHCHCHCGQMTMSKKLRYWKLFFISEYHTLSARKTGANEVILIMISYHCVSHMYVDVTPAVVVLSWVYRCSLTSSSQWTITLQGFMNTTQHIWQRSCTKSAAK